MIHLYSSPPLGGLKLDLPAQDIQRHYTPSVSGVWPINGNVTRIPGKQKYSATQLAGAVMALYTWWDESGNNYLIAVSVDKTYKYNTVTDAFDSIQDVTDFTGGVSNQFSLAHFVDNSGNDALFITNGLDAMRLWTGTGTIATLSVGTPPVGKSLCVYGNHLLLGYTIESGADYPRRVRWSDLGDGETYTAANFVDLRATSDWVKSIRRINDRAAIYKERSISMMDYVGGSLTFQLSENYISNIGAIGHNSIVEYGTDRDAHYFIGQDLNAYMFDGITCSPIGDGIRSYLISINPTYKGNICGFADRYDSKVIWMVPTGGDETNKDILILDVNDGSWWVKSSEAVATSSVGEAQLTASYTWDTLPFASWDEWDDPAGWNSSRLLANAPELLFGGNDGYVRKWVGGVDDDGTDIASYLYYPMDDFNTGRNTLKQITKIIIEVKNAGSGTVTLKIFKDYDYDNPITLNESSDRNTTVSLAGESSSNKFVDVEVDVLCQGNVFAFALTSDDTAWAGKIRRVDYEIIGENL